MKKKYNKRSFNPVLSISFIIVIFVLFLSFGFSAFQTYFKIGEASAIVRIDRDVRIVGISVDSVFQNGSSSYEEYNISNIVSSINLPNQNSTVTYNIAITNLGNIEMGILNITGLPNNLTYSINNYNLKDVLCDNLDSSRCKLGITSTIQVTIGYAENGYNSTNQNYNINLDFDFERAYTITYNGFSNITSLPSTYLEGDTKIISFTSSTGIPYDVQLVNATGSYSSPNLTITNATNNIIVNRYYSITYVLNGGTNNINNPDKCLSTDNITLNNPTYPNHIFDGWYQYSDFSGLAVTNISNANSDITLYAKFNSDTVSYNISYNLDGGTNPSNQVSSFNLSTPQNILDPVKNYYIFNGWYQNNSFTGDQITSTSQLSGNSSLYAKWTEMIQNTTYDSNTNTFTATNFSSPVSLTSFIGNSEYDYTVVNKTGSEIRRVEVTVSYTNNTGNTSSQMTCELYINGSEQAAATNSQTMRAKKTSGTITFTLSAVIAEDDTFVIKFTNSSLTNGTVSVVSFKVYDN